jgi:hypothetical protein
MRSLNFENSVRELNTQALEMRVIRPVMRNELLAGWRNKDISKGMS